jgi:hypothetical protein
MQGNIWDVSGSNVLLHSFQIGQLKVVFSAL